MLCREGAKWQGAQMLLKSDFKPVPKALTSFVVQTLEGTSCSAKIPLRRVHTIAAILEGSPINVGELIANNISDFASKNWNAIAHTSLICWLCEEVGVDLYANDLDTPLMKPLIDIYMDGFVKEYEAHILKLRAEEAAAGQPQPEPQPQP